MNFNNGNYVVVDSNFMLLKDKKMMQQLQLQPLTTDEIMLLTKIWQLRKNNKGYCYANNNFFTDFFRVDVRTIDRWLKKLSDNGFITRYENKTMSYTNQRKIYCKTDVINETIDKLVYHNIEIDTDCKTIDIDCKTIDTDCKTMDTSVYHNIEEYIENNNNIYSTSPQQDTPVEYDEEYWDDLFL